MTTWPRASTDHESPLVDGILQKTGSTLNFTLEIRPNPPSISLYTQWHTWLQVSLPTLRRFIALHDILPLPS